VAAENHVSTMKAYIDSALNSSTEERVTDVEFSWYYDLSDIIKVG
jgi:hypothetical protein